MAKGSKGTAYDKKQTAGLRKTIKSLDLALGALPDGHQDKIRGHLDQISRQYSALLGFDHQSTDIHWLGCWVGQKGASGTMEVKPAKSGKKK